MNTKDAAESLHKEHEEMAGFLTAFETALELSVSGDDETRSLGLARLREIVERSTHIRGSLSQDSEVMTSPVFLLVNSTERARLKQKLFHLERASYEFRKELAFTTTLSTEGLVEQGRQLEDMLRRQIAYEEELLREIEAGLVGDSTHLGLKE